MPLLNLLKQFMGGAPRTTDHQIDLLTYDTPSDGTPLEKRHPIVHLGMNLSSGIDHLVPGRRKTAVRPLWLSSGSADIDAIQRFYCDLLNMRVTDAPMGAAHDGLLWLTNDFRIFCIGPRPAFPHILENPARFRLPRFDKIHANMIAAGHPVVVDKHFAYARRMRFQDPAGNAVACTGA